jgi:hypothetical protein
MPHNLEELIEVITKKLVSDLRASMADLEEAFNEAVAVFGKDIDKARAMDDVVAIFKMYQNAADVPSKEILRKVREILTGKDLL